MCDVNIRDTDRAASSPDVLEAVRACVADILGLPVAAITRQDVLLDLGADSVNFLDLVFRLEKRFGIKLPRRYTIPEAHTVDAIVEAVVEAHAIHR